MSGAVTITPEDFRRLRYCSAGGRKVAERYGLDWSAFLRGEVTTADIEHIGDDLVQNLVKAAKERAQNGQQ